MSAPVSDEDLVSPFPWRPSRLLLERLVLAALLLGLFALKLSHAAHEPDYGPDASYYHDIAAHVRDGDVMRCMISGADTKADGSGNAY